MIDSGIYSKSVLLQSEIIDLDLKPESTNIQKVRSSTIYHFIHAFIKTVFCNVKLSQIEKEQSVRQFAFTVGGNIVEQESSGMIRSLLCGVQEKQKPYRAQMKFIHSRVWTILFNSSCKLYHVKDEAGSYKLQDLDFTLTKYIQPIEGQKDAKLFKKMFIFFVKGVVEGSLDRLSIEADVTVSQDGDNIISIDFRGMRRKDLTNYDPIGR